MASDDLFTSEIEDEYTQENFRRIRLELENLKEEDKKLTTGSNIIIQGTQVSVEVIPLNLQAGIEKLIYDGAKKMISYRVLDDAGEDITWGLFFKFAGPSSYALSAKSNMDLNSLTAFFFLES